MHLFAPSHQISAKGKNCGSNGRPDICGPDTVWDFSWQTSFFFISTGRLCSGGETLPRPPLAEPRQSHQQHFWAPQPGEGGERHKGRPHCGPRWVRPSQSGQHLSNPLRIRTALIIWGGYFSVWAESRQERSALWRLWLASWRPKVRSMSSKRPSWRTSWDQESLATS